MNRPTTLALSAMTLLCLEVVTFSPALAQTAKEHVGTWALVSSDTVRPDGSRAPTFGGKATGMLTFGSDGRFFYLFSRADLPKFASNNRATGTADENAAVVKGSSRLTAPTRWRIRPSRSKLSTVRFRTG